MVSASGLVDFAIRASSSLIGSFEFPLLLLVLYFGSTFQKRKKDSRLCSQSTVADEAGDAQRAIKGAMRGACFSDRVH